MIPSGLVDDVLQRLHRPGVIGLPSQKSARFRSSGLGSCLAISISLSSAAGSSRWE